MQDRPLITTAIPKHRFRIGPYSATVLGEIEAGDGRRYRWILALVPPGDAQPNLYICCEEALPGDGADGRFNIRVVNDSMSEIVDSADHWNDLETFSEAAIDLARQMLGLQNEPSTKLM